MEGEGEARQDRAAEDAAPGGARGPEARSDKAERAREDARQGGVGASGAARADGQQAQRRGLVRGRERCGGAPGARPRAGAQGGRGNGHHRAAAKQDHLLVQSSRFEVRGASRERRTQV